MKLTYQVQKFLEDRPGELVSARTMAHHLGVSSGSIAQACLRLYAHNRIDRLRFLKKNHLYRAKKETK